MLKRVWPDPITIPSDAAEAGEITAGAAYDIFRLTQVDPDNRAHVIVMSWEQARQVRDALNRLLEPVFK